MSVALSGNDLTFSQLYDVDPIRCRPEATDRHHARATHHSAIAAYDSKTVSPRAHHRAAKTSDRLPLSATLMRLSGRARARRWH